VKPGLGDDIEAGQMVLGGMGTASAGPRISAMQGGGGVLHITRDRDRRQVPASPTGPRLPPSPGEGGRYGGGRYYEIDR